MNLSTRAARAVATVLLGATTLGVAAPAMAEKVSVEDPADATASLNDVRGATLDHRDVRVRGTITVTDLRAKSDGGPASIQVFLDTDRTRKGPEYRIASGLQEGTDYQLSRIRHWEAVGGPLSCAHHLALDYADDVVRYRVKRTCLGTPESVRVAVKMYDAYDASHPVVDWLGGRRDFTSWVRSS
ncbi:hypothetical protein ACT8ZV_09625 [Nocardioides sp. MAHUQ-72]|uniref:hypothetical protein n=1 Tax=unclassified Nocardioides TaxID=2615069 RepID=UPI00361026AB